MVMGSNWLVLAIVHLCGGLFGKVTCAPLQGNPIILVPGDGGSQIEAKLAKPTVVHYLCYNETNDFFPLWVNLEQLAPLLIDCFADNMRLEYDPVTHRTNNPTGVTLRFPGWGDTVSIEYLDTSRISATAYFAAIVQGFLAIGYEKGKDVRGAPFDFRKAPNEGEEFFAALEKLVEDTYAMNSNRKVVLLGHSMGNIMLLTFLQSKPQAWKDTFVHSYIAISAPFAGSTKPVKLFASGYALGEPFIDALALRGMQRSFPSSALLLPSELAWSNDEVLVYTDRRNYTLADFETFFTDVGYPLGWETYKNTRLPPLVHPGVPVYCVFGLGVKTENSFVYKSGQFPDKQPDAVYGDGDGTVNSRSLYKCFDWKNSSYKFDSLVVTKQAEHMDILGNADVVSFVLDIAFGRK